MTLTLAVDFVIKSENIGVISDNPNFNYYKFVNSQG